MWLFHDVRFTIRSTFTPLPAILIVGKVVHITKMLSNVWACLCSASKVIVLFVAHVLIPRNVIPNLWQISTANYCTTLHISCNYWFSFSSCFSVQCHPSYVMVCCIEPKVVPKDESLIQVIQIPWNVRRRNCLYPTLIIIVLYGSCRAFLTCILNKIFLV